MKIIDEEGLKTLVARARVSTRGRLNLNLHDHPSDPIQRLLNAGEPGTYTRPHRHSIDRWELFALVTGAADVLLFADDGGIANRIELRTDAARVLEIPGGRWHSVVFVGTGTVLLEMKPGPYAASADKEFAAWAPAEGEPNAESCLRWLASGAVGSKWRYSFGANA